MFKQITFWMNYSFSIGLDFHPLVFYANQMKKKFQGQINVVNMSV